MRGGRVRLTLPDHGAIEVCRNILELRGLEPPATHDEVEAAARQFVRKVTGIRQPNAEVEPGYEAAITRITDVTRELLDQLPARRQPPKADPPLRRPEVRARLGLDPL